MKGEQMTLYNFLEQVAKNNKYDFVDFLIYDSSNNYQSDFQGAEIKNWMDESKQKIINVEPACFSENGRLFELTLYIDRPLLEVPEELK